MWVLGAGPHGHRAAIGQLQRHTKINRKDFGMTWNKTLDAGGTLLSDDVDVRIDVEAVQKPAEAK
jgi:polyisoprenoid-binding protein YceI